MKTWIVALALGSALTGPALAADLVIITTAGNWEIYKDPNNGDACLAQARYGDGTLLRFGYRDGGTEGFVANFSPAWRTLSADGSRPVSFTVDGKAFEGETVVAQSGALPGVEVNVPALDVLKEVAAGNEISFVADGQAVTRVGLAGGVNALNVITHCQGL